jgi:rhomboid protease GluP
LKDTCVECQVREKIARDQQIRANRPSTWQIAMMFPVTSAIVVINLLVFAGSAIQSLMTGRGSPLDFQSLLLLGWGANYGPLTLDHQFWRIFTCMFVHGGLIHVGANMWCFWDFGRIAERVYGRWRFAVIYLLTGLASSIASLAIHPTTVSVGASGAIFGVVGALVFPFYRKRVVLPPPVMKAMMRSLVTFIVINLLIGSAIPVIDNSAHVGGLLAGLALGAVITQLSMAGSDLQTLFPKVAATAAVLIGFAFAGVQHLHRDRLHAQRAVLALQQGDFKAAIEGANQVVARDPKNILAHLTLGEAYWAQRQYAEATKEYRAAYDLDPNDADIAAQLGNAYVATAQWKEAESVLHQALKSHPNDATLLQNLGIALAAQNREEEALTYLRQAVANYPGSAKANYALGSVLLDQRKFQEALGPLQQAVKLDPQNTEFKKTLDVASAQATSQSLQSK